MEMESTYDPGAIEARWLGRREPGSVLPPGVGAGDPQVIVTDIFDRRAAMGGGEPVEVTGPDLPEIDPGLADGGIDAVRFGVALLHRESSPVERGDSRLGQGRRFVHRRFVHKLWHASRFALLRLGARELAQDAAVRFEDRWILSRLHRAVRRVGEHLDSGRLAPAAERADMFVRREFSGWYLPLVKPRTDAAATETLREVLHTVLPLLHPILPVMTEEIRNHLSRVLGEAPVALDEGPWPATDETRFDGDMEGEMDAVLQIVRRVRNLQATAGVHDGADAHVRIDGGPTARIIERHADRIVSLAGLRSLFVGADVDVPEGAATVVVGDSEVYLTFDRAVDTKLELARLTREYEELSGLVRACERQFGNRDFLERAPADVVARERARRDDLADRVIKIQQHIEALE